MVGAFLRQSCARYRDFQLMFTLLTLNFALPAISYVFVPEVSQEQFADLNVTLGGVVYDFPEAQSVLWRVLGAANVCCLAFMCALLQWNLPRFYPVLVPLTFLKSTAATLWLFEWIKAPQLPACLAAAILDYVTSAAFVFFAVRAHRQIVAHPDATLVPAPRGSSR